MDLSPVINQLMGLLWTLIPLIILATLLKSSWFKGISGEFFVNVMARWMLDKNEYHLIKNVTLATEDGTTQIDHVIVSRYGVFVVETKNMKGWIFGSAKQKSWTQKIYKQTNKFQNPLHQNYKHVKTLEALLALKDHQLHSVVVFVGDSQFKTKMPENVTFGGGYVRYIKSKQQVVFSTAEVEEIISKIKSGRLMPSFKTDRDHVRHLESNNIEKLNRVTCPKCGSLMVIRESKKDQHKGNRFWGCSRFPQCRGLMKII